MTVDFQAPYRTRVRQALADERLRVALDRATGRLSGRRVQAMGAVDGARLRDEARTIREHAIANLPDLLETLERNLTANRCTVHWAHDAGEATRVIGEIAGRHGVRKVVKSKSMVTEEIHLNTALEQTGIDVVETDLGEYIIQLAGEPPSHIIAPVIHKRAEDIGELFHARLDMPRSSDPQDICAAARERLRQEFLAADMGISGCNFAVAETGTLCIITNEGNGRMVTTLPRVYVAVVGIEKVVPTLEDAVLLWQATTRSATGQEVSVYFTLNSGPRRAADADGPDEVHVVLVDNGRSRLLERGYADALLCVRCGACLNVCPVYREIGGHAYGSPYGGPIGAVVTPLLAQDLTAAAELPHASSLCGACRDVCPVQIDIPRLLLDLRSDLVRQGASAPLERWGIGMYTRATSSARRYGRAVRRLRRLVRLFSRRGKGPRRLPPPFNRWTRHRVFPLFPDETFREWWARPRPSAEDDR